MPDTDTRLETVRYRMLARQLIAELGTAKKAAPVLGVDASYLSTVFKPGRNVGLHAVNQAKSRLRLRSAFFEEGGAEDRLDYHDYVRGVPETTVEYDSDQGYAQIEAYIEAEEESGRPILPGHKLELRALRSRLGAEKFTYDVIRQYHTGLVMRDRGKAIEGPTLNEPIDTEAGQRPLPPIKKGPKRSE